MMANTPSTSEMVVAPGLGYMKRTREFAASSPFLSLLTNEKTGLVVLYKGTHLHGLQGWGEAILYRHESGKLKRVKSVTIWRA